jgi:hypothetical protein
MQIKLINDFDPNDTFVVDGADLEEAMYNALNLLGWIPVPIEDGYVMPVEEPLDYLQDLKAERQQSVGIVQPCTDIKISEPICSRLTYVQPHTGASDIDE